MDFNIGFEYKSKVTHSGFWNGLYIKIPMNFHKVAIYIYKCNITNFNSYCILAMQYQVDMQMEIAGGFLVICKPWLIYDVKC
jgi:hypothetical protein